MKIAVLGATGATGRDFIRLATGQGHEITALARSAGRLDEFPDIRVVIGDATRSDDIAAVVHGQDAVFSSLGLSITGGADEVVTVCTTAVSHLLATLPRTGPRRLVVMSTHGVGDSHDDSPYVVGLWSRLGERLRDKDTMEELLPGSTLDWTVVRAPRISEDPAGGSYRVGNAITVAEGGHIPRADLCEFVLGELTRPRHLREMVTIAV